MNCEENRKPSAQPDAGQVKRELTEQEREQNRSAFEEAMHDIDGDADLSVRSPNDDLDEGETARLGEDRTDLV